MVHDRKRTRLDADGELQRDVVGRLNRKAYRWEAGCGSLGFAGFL